MDSRIAGSYEETGGRYTLRWLLGILLVTWLTAAAPRAWGQGLAFVLAGTWMLFAAPQTRLPRWVWVLALAWAGASLLSFLPLGGGAMPDWRQALASAGIDLGNRITPQPRAALYSLAGQLVTGLVLLRIFCQRPAEGTRTVTAAYVVAAVLAYLVLSWMRLRWSAGVEGTPHFGFFPNRNHTATLLVMGAMMGFGLLIEAVRGRAWRMLAFSLTAVGLLASALIFTSISRAGVILLGAGSASIWFLCGFRYLGEQSGRITGILALSVVVLLVLPESQVKERLIVKVQGALEEPESPEGVRLDERLEIFHDTAEMIRQHPLTGWGAGQYEYVFPQYRRLAANVNNGRNLHPESSWLWMASESGIPAALSLLAVASGMVVIGVRAARRNGSGRGLRCACLVASAVPLLHAFIDVPLHREGLLWLAGLLYVLGCPLPDTMISRRGVMLWRAAGAGVLLCGAAVLGAGLSGKPIAPTDQAETKLAEAKRIYDRDQATTAALDPNKPPAPPDSSKPDPLEVAMSDLDEAIRAVPMDPRPHGLHGMLALHFDDQDQRARADFVRQRLLIPSWVRLPVIQAEAWKKINISETTQLWKLAITRARTQRAVPGADPTIVPRTYSALLLSSLGQEELENEALAIAGGDQELLSEACRILPKQALMRLEPRLRPIIGKLQEPGPVIKLLDERLGSGTH